MIVLSQQKVEIVTYDEKYDKDFERLNLEWLEAYFTVEPYDLKVLKQPHDYIIEPGGEIFYAIIGDTVVGTVALIKRGKDVFELSKMAVTREHQGYRIGQKLMYACIDHAGQCGVKKLYLESNTKLIPALTLYRKVGFKEVPHPGVSEYARSNIKMELEL